MATDRVTVVSPDTATIERITGRLQAAGFDVEPAAPRVTDPAGRPDRVGGEWVLLDCRSGVTPDQVSVPGPREGSGEPGEFRPATLEEVERKHLAAMLEHTRGNKRQAALLLGIARSTLQQKVRRYGFDRGVTE